MRQDTLISPLSFLHHFTVRFDHILWSIITTTSSLALSAILFSKHTPTPTHSCCYNPLHCTLLFLLLFLLFLFLLCRLSPFYLYFLYFLLDQSFSLGKGWRLPPPHKHTFSLYFSSLNVYFTVTNLEDDGDGYVYDYELIIIIIHETYLYNTHTHPYTQSGNHSSSVIGPRFSLSFSSDQFSGPVDFNATTSSLSLFLSLYFCTPLERIKSSNFSPSL